MRTLFWLVSGVTLIVALAFLRELFRTEDTVTPTWVAQVTRWHDPEDDTTLHRLRRIAKAQHRDDRFQ